jgi:NADH:ubiquinone oxidoreductase subunit C
MADAKAGGKAGDAKAASDKEAGGKAAYAKAAATKPDAKTADAKAAPAKPEAPAAPEPSGDHATLAAQFPDDVLGYRVLEDGNGVTRVAPDGLFAVATTARRMGYRILSLLSAYDNGTSFGVLYAFVAPANDASQWRELRLEVLMPKKDGESEVDPEVQSIVDAYPAAGWQEREMYDMYGIRFSGNPDLRRMFLPEGWEGFPMRKDYKEPEQFVALRDGEDHVVKTQEEGSW